MNKQRKLLENALVELESGELAKTPYYSMEIARNLILEALDWQHTVEVVDEVIDWIDDNVGWMDEDARLDLHKQFYEKYHDPT